MEKISFSSVVGSLTYGMDCTCPDLAHVMSVVNCFMANPSRSHWMAVKWMLKYLRRSSKNVLSYGGTKVGEKPSILGFSDADYVVDLDKRRSTTAYVFKLWNSSISWKSSL